MANLRTFIYPGVAISSNGLATEAKQDVIIAQLQDVNSELDTQSGYLQTLSTTDFATETTLNSANNKLNNIVTNTAPLRANTVFFEDGSPIMDTAVTPIPGSASPPLEIIAASIADVLKMQFIEDIGEYYGIYIGPAGFENLAVIAPLGGGTVNVIVPGGNRISIRSLTTSAISSGKLAINFIL